MTELLRGLVQSGKGDASRWLSRFNAAYSRKLGSIIYPGSLNLALDHAFNWFDPKYAESLNSFGRQEYGGERDILFIPSSLPNLGQRRAWLWTTTTSARDGSEVVVLLHLRNQHSHSQAMGRVDA
jgi:hypothetical protein